jgi:peptidoglycan/LPS O-acetylase OafA/YrhL
MAEAVHDRLAVVDGLRGVAILAVIFEHFYFPSLVPFITPEYFADYPYDLNFWWLAVNLFFILSGFVLYRPYRGKMREMKAGDFYRHRFFRLMPLFTFMVLVTSLLRTFPVGQRIEEALLDLSTANLFTTGHWFSTLNGSWWSIGIEIWFSLLFPLLWWASRRSGAWRLYWAVAGVAYLVRVFGAGFPFGVNYNLNPVKDCVLARLDDFVLGFVLCETYVKGELKLPPALMFLLGALLFAATAHGWALRAEGSLSSFQVAALNNLAQGAFFLMSLACLRSQGLLRRLLTLWPLRVAGAMCFSLYLFHGAVMVMAQQISGYEQNVLDLAYMGIVTVLLSAFTYRYIEFGRVLDWRALFLLSKTGNGVQG